MSASDAAIAGLFAAYAEALDDADADAILDLFAYPAIIWQFGKGHVFADADDLAENVEILLDAYADAGIVASEAEVGAIQAMGATAFAAVRWRQSADDGEALHEFACAYTLLLTPGGWRIAAIVNDPDERI